MIVLLGDVTADQIPERPPTTTSDGKCTPAVTRSVLAAVAIAIHQTATGHFGYSCAITEASVQVNVECPEGNEPLLKLPEKNLPSPPPLSMDVRAARWPSCAIQDCAVGSAACRGHPGILGMRVVGD